MFSRILNLRSKKNFHDFFCFLFKGCKVSFLFGNITSRVRQRFFDQIGHETMYASIGNKHFFTKSRHRQTYQNCEQPP